MEMPEILFIDFDGVLRSIASEYYWMRQNLNPEFQFDPMAMECLKTLLDCMPDLKLVLHSHRREDLEGAFARELGLEFSRRITGKTAWLLDGKEQEIPGWLKRNPGCAYAILEDHPLALENIVPVHPYSGLTMKEVYTVLELFGSQTGKTYSSPPFIVF